MSTKPGHTTWPPRRARASPSRRVADAADPAAGDGDVGGPARGAGPVDHRASPDDDVGAHAPIVAAPGSPCTRELPTCGRSRIPWVCRARAVCGQGWTTRQASAGLECTHGGSVFQEKGRRPPNRTTRCRSRAPSWPPPTGPPPSQLVDAGHAAHGLGVVRDQYVRKIRKTPTIRMVPSSMMVEGRRLRFAVSDNVDAYGPDGPGTPPVWAVNIHGYFAGGGMYWRESARLAEQLGWRVDQPEPARLRRQRPARVAGRLHGEPGQPGHGDRAQGRGRPGRAARPLHGRRGRRAVRARPPAAHARHDLPRRRQHAGVEGAHRHPPDLALADPARRGARWST